MVLLLLVLGAASLASAAPVWLRSSGATALAERVDVTVTGTSAAPGVSAAALVVIAAALALGLVGRVGRWFALAVVWLAGLVAGGSALAVIRSPADAARTAVAEATGIVAHPTPSTSRSFRTSPWCSRSLSWQQSCGRSWRPWTGAGRLGGSTRHRNRPVRPTTNKKHGTH